MQEETNNQEMTNQAQQISGTTQEVQKVPLDNPENLDINLTTERTQGWSFYTIRTTDSGNFIDMKIANILKFLEIKGFRRLKMPNGGYELVKIHKNSILIFSDTADMMETVRKQLIEIDRQPEVWEAFMERNYLTSQMDHAMERIKEVKLNQATKTHSYFFFENGVVEVTKDKIKMISYENYHGYIFEDQIIKHPFEIQYFVNNENTMFDNFLQNVTNNDPKRYDYLTSSLGYLMHTYKDKTLTRAVILVDEEIDFEGGAEGGTGKTLITEAVSYMVKSAVKDGRALVTGGNRFFYQDIDLSHRLMIIDDISSDTHFEKFFSVVTGGMTVEKKGKQSFSIPFELSPKLLITSNYMVSGAGGNSEERRKIEVEIAPYYRSKSIKEEFGCTFFGDWDAREWNLFYNKMITYCQKFLKHNIMYSEPINLIENKLISETDFSFVEFMDSNVIFNEENPEFKAEKAKFFKAYKDKHPLESKQLTINMFKKWTNKYASVRNYDIEHQKSNSKSYLKISVKPQLEKENFKKATVTPVEVPKC